MNISNNKKKILIYLSGVLAIPAIVFLAVYVIKGLSRVTTDDAYIEGRIHTIAAKINGTVKGVHVQDNQKVKKGELILEIDPVDYELKVHEAQASLNIRKVSLGQTSRDKERAEALYTQEIFPKERYENAFTAYNLARAQLKAAEVQLKIAQRNLEYTKIYAPTAGYVTKKSVELGNQLQPGQPLMAVVDIDDLWVTANYKETQLKNVRVGQRAEIKVDTYPGSTFTGSVESIMAGTGAVFSLFPPENALGNYVKVVQRIPVKIVFDNGTYDHHNLHIGMSCIPTIFTKDEPGK
jgi:membrane fusion protein (multidrug efflux system)